ncbi:MAG TPA: Rne/Rng family ribonuclease [Gemmatimonadales bacterium]|nr:Rne/Rng family ribonuclease [Gemmatimonadales bacterium]
MKREILINGTQRETRVAILEDDRLVELLVDRPDNRRIVGDIYLGRVEAVLPGIQAAFVDVGLEKSAFLHASDVLEPDDEHDPDEEPSTSEYPVVTPETATLEPDQAGVDDPPADEERGPAAEPAPEAGQNGGEESSKGGGHRRSRRRRRRRRGNGATGIEGENAPEPAAELVSSGEPAAELAPELEADADVEAPAVEEIASSQSDGVPEAGVPDAGRSEAAPGPAAEPAGKGRRQRGRGNGQPQPSKERSAPPPAPRQREVSRRGAVPNIADVVKKGETFLVQVTKEPISTKGCRVTKVISLPGRFLVYMPFASKVGVSRKIESREQRSKLREMVSRLLPKGEGGVIVRTVAEGTTEEHFKREIDSLLHLWKKINKKMRFVRAPALIQRETSLTRGIIRDLFSDKVDGLWCDSKELHHEIEQYLEQVDPELKERVHLYTGAQPLFEKFDIEREIKDLFKARCELPNGGSIVIQPTEALVSIDVNTGRYTGKKDPEKTILRTNLEAAREIARQLRLRDVGGIIVCDFIDMETRQNRERVLNELRAHLSHDRARTKAHAVSELGLIEMTRQRVRPSLWQSMTTDCPTCSGTGRVLRPEVVARRLERSLQRAGYEHRDRQLAVRLHPDVALYLLEEEPKLVQSLGRQIGIELEVRDDPMMRLDEFRLMSRPAGRDVTELYAVA